MNQRYNTYQEPESGLSVLVYSRNIVVQHGGFCSKDILLLDTALEPKPRSVLWKLLSGVEAKKVWLPGSENTQIFHVVRPIQHVH